MPQTGSIAFGAAFFSPDTMPSIVPPPIILPCVPAEAGTPNPSRRAVPADKNIRRVVRKTLSFRFKTITPFRFIEDRYFMSTYDRASDVSPCGPRSACPGEGALSWSELAFESLAGGNRPLQLHSRSAKFPPLARPLFHQKENDRRDEEHVDGGSDHPAHDRCRDRTHDLGAGPRGPEDRNERERRRGDGHQLRPQPQDRPFARRLEDVLAGQLPLSEPLVEGLVEIDHHDDARLDRDAIKGDVADPDGDREVVAQQPLEDHAARHGIDDGERDDRPLG